VEVLRL